MKILFFSHYFPPEGNAPASRTYENCRRWAREGHDVTVVTCAPNSPDGVLYAGYRNRPWSRQTREGLTVMRVWTYIAANQGTTRRVVNYLSYMVSAVLAAPFLGKPDVVVATSPQFFCGWAGVIAARMRGVPLVLEIRDLWPESIAALQALRSARLLRLLERMEKAMYAAAAHVVTVGEGYRRRLVERGVTPGRLSTVTNGIDRELFVPREPDEALRRRLKLGRRFVCTYCGTIGMACGLDIVLRAGEILRDRGRDDIVFLLVGEGAVRRELEARARDKGLRNVIFTGRLDKGEIPGVLSVSDACLVHLRKVDLFTTVLPSKIFEAAGMARPIINGVAGEAERLVRDAGAGLCIEPENERELVDAVERLADAPELRRSLGRAGLAYVVAHHDRDRLARRYIELIRGVEAAWRQGRAQEGIE